MKKTYLFTSESVSAGHPDKVSDRISDSILDEFLRQDPDSKVACEVFCTTGLVVVGGEVSAEAYVDVQSVAREAINDIGYNKAEYMFDGSSCGVLSALHEQSPDIHRGVASSDPGFEQGAGDQGIMFGYATDETPSYMPLSLYLSHRLLQELDAIRKGEDQALMPYLRPDAKSQFTVEYEVGTDRPIRIHTIVLSTQHDEFVPDFKGTYEESKKEYRRRVEEGGAATQDALDEAIQAKIRSDVARILLPRLVASLPEKMHSLFGEGITLYVNPTGKFTIGGPHGDTGLTGRKIIVDTYGGKASHGGGAFSGKDPSKVDRSAAYAARYVAKNMVAAGVASQMMVQFSYAIGVAHPLSIYVNTYGSCRCSLSDEQIAQMIPSLIDLRPRAIIEHFGLKNPIYKPTSSYGHFGREPYTEDVSVIRNGVRQMVPARFFSWEDLDLVDEIKAKLNLV